MIHGINSSNALSSNREESIRMRAYELYLRRGKLDGRALEDWLQAEEEILEGATRHWAWRHDVERNSPEPKK